MIYCKPKMKKLVLFLAALVALSAGGTAQTRKNAVFFGGGVNHHFVYGSDADYELGVNDFPVTPAHTPMLLGMSFARFGRWIGGEIEGRWTWGSGVVLEDPSDGDSVEVRAGPHVSILASLVFKPWRGTIQPYCLAGGGVDIILSKDAEVTTAYGYEISLPAPDFKNRFDPEVHAGAGMLVFFRKNWGIRLEGRLVWILDRPQAVRCAQAFAGVFFAF